jgi:hypothetical protein
MGLLRNPVSWQNQLLYATGFTISSFGTDESEVYLLNIRRENYRLTSKMSSTTEWLKTRTGPWGFLLAFTGFVCRGAWGIDTEMFQARRSCPATPGVG